MRDCVNRAARNSDYREAQLDITPEMEVFHMQFERCHTRNRKRSIKQHIKYFNFRSQVQLDHPVQACAEKWKSFAKHQPGAAGCGWLEPGRNFLST